MHILLSNDDGVLSPGLAALRAAVADLGEVTVVAPMSAQSAAGQAITVRHPLVVQEVHVRGPEEFRASGVDGRPADGVRLALRKLLPERPDLVLAGINHGANVGVHVFYSGTIAAAAEGALCGVPAVAFSAELAGGEFDFPRLGRICRRVLDALLAGGLRAGDLFSVNVPALGPDAPRGVRVVGQSTADVLERYEHLVDADGRDTYSLDEYEFPSGSGDTDVDGLAAGYVTVTPLHVDRTDRRRLEELGQVAWGPLED
jgi:5'-nucleotidase